MDGRGTSSLQQPRPRASRGPSPFQGRDKQTHKAPPSLCFERRGCAGITIRLCPTGFGATSTPLNSRGAERRKAQRNQAPRCDTRRRPDGRTPRLPALHLRLFSSFGRAFRWVFALARKLIRQPAPGSALCTRAELRNRRRAGVRTPHAGTAPCSTSRRLMKRPSLSRTHNA